MAAKSKIGKAFEAASSGSTTAMDDEVSEETSEPDAEVLAIKQFEKAKSPEDKAAALKDFLRACGALGYEEEDTGMGAMDAPMPDLGF